MLLLPVGQEWQPPWSVALLDSGFRDFQISADLPREEVVDLAVARNRGTLSREVIDINGVPAPFPQELAATPLQVTEGSLRFTPKA